MSALLLDATRQTEATPPTATAAVLPLAMPIVIVGAGPVGLRVAQELVRRVPDTPVIVYGDEQWQPYNRVRLSSFLAGELGWKSVVEDSLPPQGVNVELRLGYAIVAIDRRERTVVDAAGRSQCYSKLVLATGSRPIVPQIRGIDLPGVFTFRDLADAERLLARRVRSRSTVVLGGGLLGLEAARAMRRYRTEVCVVEHGPHLMGRQLDAAAAEVLKAGVEARGIHVVVDDAVREVQGEGSVTGVRLRSGGVIECDTLIIAAGIAPNIQLAIASGLAIGRGVRVDDAMATSDPDVYAAGECAEHRGRVYGLVAPGLEQAAVAAHSLLGGDSQYTGSVAATRLKVIDTPVFSIGAIGELMPREARRVGFTAENGKGTRAVVVRRGRLEGALAIGHWDELSRVQEAVTHRRRVWPWQLWRFAREGQLYRDQAAADVNAWPDSAVVCNCTGVTCGQLRAARLNGCATALQLSAATGASSVCGSCRPCLDALAGSRAPAAPVRGAAWLWALGVAAVVGALLLLLAPGINYPDTADLRWRWDAIWRNSLYKQASGYTLLAVMALLAAVSLRKRVKPICFGEFSGWRVVHVGLGLAALLVLIVHSGGRLGANLNAFLSLSVLGAAGAGALVSAAIAREHSAPAAARRLRNIAFWTHVLFLWPLPVLLAFHVFKFYFF